MYRLLLFFICLIVSIQSSYSQDAQQPTIMVFPSDNLLKRLDCLKEYDNQGAKVYLRDYQKAFVEDINLKFIISSIQERFSDLGFPLQDMEYNLKQLQTERAIDNSENFDADAKTILLKTARPDIFLDLDYEFRDMGMYNQLIFIINAIDAYTYKSVASAQHPGVETSNNSVVNAMAEQVEMNINNLQSLMQKHFDDLKKNGREITLRVAIENDAISDFRRERCGKYPYHMMIQQWIKANTVNGAHRRDMVSAKELKFTQIRIPLYDENGFPQGASDWAFKLSEKITEECGLIGIDFTQSLGDAFIVISN